PAPRPARGGWRGARVGERSADRADRGLRSPEPRRGPVRGPAGGTDRRAALRRRALGRGNARDLWRPQPRPPRLEQRPGASRPRPPLRRAGVAQRSGPRLPRWPPDAAVGLDLLLAARVAGAEVGPADDPPIRQRAPHPGAATAWRHAHPLPRARAGPGTGDDADRAEHP